MVRYIVLSLNPTTKSPGLMVAETLEHAESQQRRALADGRLLAVIVTSWAEHEAWRQVAAALAASLP